MARRYWLFKSEPEEFSIDDLARGGSAPWEGVRNFQARNYLRDDCRRGDGVLFYHSGTAEPGVAGTATIVREAYPDPTQFDRASSHFDPGARRDDPRWYLVDVAFASRFARPVTLAELRGTRGLENMLVLRRGNRLSVTPVTAAEWRIVTRLGAARR